MPYGLAIGDDARVAAWVFSTFNLQPIYVDMAFGIVGSNGVLIGGILFTGYNGTNIELSYYGHRTLTKGIVRFLARIAVLKFNIARCTVVTSKKNKRLMRSLQRFGWRLEGTQRCYYGHRDCSRNTGVRFVLFRPEINRLGQLPPNEQMTTHA